MAQNRELGELGQYLSVNTTSNVVSINAVSISVGNSSVNVSINSTAFSGTSLSANNSSYLGGTVASGYQTTAGLSANVATLTSNSATYLGSSSSFGNTSGIFTTGIVNAASFTISNNFIANSTAITINNTAAIAARSITGQFRIVGPDSDLVHAVQDGNGRYNIYWNSSGTPSQTYLVSNEPVTRLQMTIDATSNGGIIGFYGAPSGTANAAITSTQFFASLVGAAASTNNYIWMSPRGTSSDFYMVANGNIGSGNTTPANPFVISDKSGNPMLFITASNSSYTPVYGAQSFGSDPGLIMRRADGTAAVPIATQTDSRLGYVIGATSSDGTTWYNTTAINLYAATTANSTSQPTYITFQTTPSGAVTRTERMRIVANGNIGIGTSSPGYLLDVNGHVNATRYYLTNTNSTYAWGDTSGWQFIGSGYVYFNQTGPTYSQTRINARAGIGDDVNTTLTLYGGTGGYTTVNGSTRSPIFYDSDDTSYYFNGADESRFKRVRIGPYAGSSSTGNVTGLEIVNNGGTGESNLAAIAFHCSGTYATHMHLRADGYFGIGGWSASPWRWYVNMNNGDMVAAGGIYAVGDVVSAFSDRRLKTNIQTIDNPIAKVKKLSGIRYQHNDLAISHGYKDDSWQIGVLAQEVEQVLPEIVKPAPFDVEHIDGKEVSKSGENYKTVQYEKLIPLLIEAIKEQQKQIDALTEKIGG